MAGPGFTDPGTRREGDPSPEIQAILEAIQDAMGLPWLPFPWQAYARQPTILKLFWSRLSAATGSEVFLRESLAIAGSVHMGVSSWFHPSADVSLSGSGSEGVTLAHALDAFEFGFPQLLIQQAALARLLRGLEAGVEGNALPRVRPSPFRHQELTPPSWERLDPETRAAAEELRAAWSIPQTSVEILSLARWPGFLRRAVADLKAVRMRPEYRTWRRRVADMGEDALDRLRPRVSLPEAELRKALRETQTWAARADRLKDMTRSFTIILPSLILDNSLLRMAAAAWMPAEEAYSGRP